MIDIDFEDQPMVTGERRRMVLRGNGPFMVSKSCFIDEPPPPGFRPCPACGVYTVAENQPFDIETSSFWQGKKGTLVIEIKDATGNSRQIKIEVISSIDSEAEQIMMES